MSTTPIAELLPDVLLGVSGVAEPVALHALWQACEAFCDRSMGVVQDQVVALEAGEGVIYPDHQTRLSRVLQVVVEGVIVPPFKGGSLVPTQREGGWGFTVSHEGVLRVLGVTGDVADVRYAVVPLRGATEVPSVLVSRYSSAIVDGAKALLRGMAGTVWFDPASAAHHAGLFRGAIAVARVDGATGVAVGSSRVAPVNFV
jgi:hypothetical protein